MNQPHILLNAAVVASSVLLAGGLVFYRAGAFDGLLKPGAATQAGIIPGSVPPDTPETRSPSDSGFTRLFREFARDTVRETPAYFYGSKSSPDIIRYRSGDSAKDRQSGASKAGERDTVQRRERHMGGSKSLAPLIESPGSDTDEILSPQTPKP